MFRAGHVLPQASDPNQNHMFRADAFTAVFADCRRSFVRFGRVTFGVLFIALHAPHRAIDLLSAWWQETIDSDMTFKYRALGRVESQQVRLMLFARHFVGSRLCRGTDPCTHMRPLLHHMSSDVSVQARHKAVPGHTMPILPSLRGNCSVGLLGCGGSITGSSGRPASSAFNAGAAACLRKACREQVGTRMSVGWPIRLKWP